MWWAAQAMAASAQPTILRGLSALPPSRPPSHRVGISGPLPNNAIKPALGGDFPAHVLPNSTGSASPSNGRWLAPNSPPRRRTNPKAVAEKIAGLEDEEFKVDRAVDFLISVTAGQLGRALNKDTGTFSDRQLCHLMRKSDDRPYRVMNSGNRSPRGRQTLNLA